MIRKVLVGILVGALLGALAFGSIAAVTPGTWSNLEATVIGLWVGVSIGAFGGAMTCV